MITNADRIAEWRAAHSTERLTAPTLLRLLGLTTLRGANLRGVDLCWVNLYGADLDGADLHGAKLLGAVHQHFVTINAGASGLGLLYPQADGWRVSIGCWRHRSLDEFADLLADRIDWPEARGKERERCRPLLQAIYGMCLAFVDQMPSDLIDRHAAARAEVAS